MNSETTTFIHTVRKFNRFYTNILGLLDSHLLHSDFSLSEARVLYEIENTEKCTAKKLIDKLHIDAGYMSRIIKRFEKQELTYRLQSEEDGRLYYLHLTEHGKEALAALDALSNDQIRTLMSTLSEQDKTALAKSMTSIEKVLSSHNGKVHNVHIRHDLKPGDAGTLISLHGSIYAKECGYNHIFEGYVCQTFYEFFTRYNPDKDRIWLAELNGEIIGAIAVISQATQKAQIRWFILHPDYRGIGLGKTLLEGALQYCKDKGYNQVFLETTEDQEAAIRMYQKAGFTKISEHRNHAWGVDHVEQVYELNLTS